MKDVNANLAMLSLVNPQRPKEFRYGRTWNYKISGFGVDGSSENVLFADKSIDSLTSLLKNADDKLDGAIKFYVGQVIGTTDAYLVTDSDGLGYTHVIKLTGVTLTTISFSDILSWKKPFHVI